MTAPFLFQHLNVYLGIAVFLLCTGILGLLFRRTLVGMLISVELILNGAGLNLVALNHFLDPGPSGVVFTLFIMGIAAAETAVALGIILLIFRRFKHIDGEDMKEMRD